MAGNLGDEEIQQRYPIEADMTRGPRTATRLSAGSAIIENKAASVQIPTGYVVCARP